MLSFILDFFFERVPQTVQPPTHFLFVYDELESNGEKKKGGNPDWLWGLWKTRKIRQKPTKWAKRIVTYQTRFVFFRQGEVRSWKAVGQAFDIHVACH